jgi:hypothetical protein
MSQRREAIQVLLLTIMALLVPWFVWRVVQEIPPAGTWEQPVSGGTRFPASRQGFAKRELEANPLQPEWLTHVQIVDFDGDERSEIVVCDGRRQRIVVYRESVNGDWLPETIAENLIAPAHATVIDLDQDGDRDVVVAVLGDLWPNDSVIGKVVLLEHTERGFEPRVLLDDVRRVADVQAGDLDGDGDLDLAVAVFGYARGEILWLENVGSLRFRDHRLFVGPGTIHVPLSDYDQDGDLDIAAVVSQDLEEVWGFENLGSGQFQMRKLFGSANFDLGSAGLVASDLDQDGDVDLVLPVGDNLEDLHSYPQPYHGCFWLENQGHWNFAARRIAQFGGTYAAAVGDLDGDRDQDVVLVSMFNDWDQPGNASLIWLENDGRQNFTPWQIADRPTHLVTVSCGDLNGDGRADIVTGGLNLVPPFDRTSGVTLWLSRSQEAR